MQGPQQWLPYQLLIEVVVDIWVVTNLIWTWAIWNLENPLVASEHTVFKICGMKREILYGQLIMMKMLKKYTIIIEKQTKASGNVHRILMGMKLWLAKVQIDLEMKNLDKTMRGHLAFLFPQLLSQIRLQLNSSQPIKELLVSGKKLIHLRSKITTKRMQFQT
jgi:hypothetical protein